MFPIILFEISKGAKQLEYKKKIIKWILVEGKAKQEDCGAQNMVHERK